MPFQAKSHAVLSGMLMPSETEKTCRLSGICKKSHGNPGRALKTFPILQKNGILNCNQKNQEKGITT